MCFPSVEIGLHGGSGSTVHVDRLRMRNMIREVRHLDLAEWLTNDEVEGENMVVPAIND